MLWCDLAGSCFGCVDLARTLDSDPVASSASVLGARHLLAQMAKRGGVQLTDACLGNTELGGDVAQGSSLRVERSQDHGFALRPAREGTCHPRSFVAPQRLSVGSRRRSRHGFVGFGALVVGLDRSLPGRAQRPKVAYVVGTQRRAARHLLVVGRATQLESEALLDAQKVAVRLT